MSRWLKNVNNLLEKLDSTAETVVEERRLAAGSGEEDDDDFAGAGPLSGSSIDDILAKRGLDDNDADDEEEEGESSSDVMVTARGEDQETETTTTQSIQQQESTSDDGAWGTDDEDLFVDASESAPEEPQTPGEPQIQTPSKESDFQTPTNDQNYSQSQSKEGEENVVTKPEATADPTSEATSEPLKSPPQSSNSMPPETPLPKQRLSYNDTSTSSGTVFSTPLRSPPAASKPKVSMTSTAASSKAAPAGGGKQPPMVPKKELQDAQKESRTLRRHVVSLNSQLEAAESELSAQRAELERAAERMEKDRRRVKEEREKAQKQHADELKALKTQQDLALKDLQKRMDDQMATYRSQLSDIENRRKQEGGDWNKELAQALEREQKMIEKVNMIEDEKMTLLSQISTLRGQQEALESRLGSLTQTSDSAMDREREAEDRLDAALSLHAKQISQRQSREAELERTIQELGAALVVARNREVSRQKSGSGSSENGEESMPKDVHSMKAKMEALENDLETVNAHLALERERSQTLHQELREMSKQATEEASIAHAKQLQHDRQTADLNVTISKLQSSLREAERSSSSKSSDDKASKETSPETANQLKLLSEEVMRLREKVANQNSESVAMRNRLKVATDRATKAEDELTEARMIRSSSGNLDIESGLPNGMSRRRRGGDQSGPSIRSVMRLEPGQGEGKEQIGKVVDALDSFAVSSGKIMRKNPLARAGFIAYLLLIHIWTFILIFFHAHNFESVHGDFGAGVSVSHGPHALMQQHPLSDPKLIAAKRASP